VERSFQYFFGLPLRPYGKAAICSVTARSSMISTMILTREQQSPESGDNVFRKSCAAASTFFCSRISVGLRALAAGGSFIAWFALMDGMNGETSRFRLFLLSTMLPRRVWTTVEVSNVLSQHTQE